MISAINKWTTSHEISRRARFCHINIFFLEVIFGLQKSKGTLYRVYHCKLFLRIGSHRFLYSLVLNLRALTPWIVTLSYFLREHAIKHNHKPTATPPLTIIADAYNHSLPPFASLVIVTSPPPSIPYLSSIFPNRGVLVHHSQAKTIIAIGITKTNTMTGQSLCRWYSSGANLTVRPGTAKNNP